MSGQRRYKTVYTCDVCNVAVFPTLREAEVHEAQCQGPPPSFSHAPGSVAQDSSAFNSDIAKVFSDAGASKAPFPSSGATDTAKGEGETEEVDNEVISIHSSCDQSSEAPVEDSASKQHGETPSTSEKQRGANFNQGKNSQSPTSESVDRDAQQAAQAKDTAGTGAPHENAQNAEADDDVEYATVWICDVCQLARFDTYDEAVAHEKDCKGPPVSDAHKKDPLKRDNLTNDNLPSVASTYPSNSGGKNAKKILLLSPVAQTHDPTEISHRFFTILQSLDLLYHPQSGLISFNCHYCSTPLPISGASWNFKRVVEVLPNAVTMHLLGQRYSEKRCVAVPPTVLDKLKSAENTDSSRVPSFETFIHKLFRGMDIEARKTDALYVYNKVASSSDDGKELPGTSKKRQGSGKGREQSPPKKQKAVSYPVSLKVKQHGNMGASLQMNEQGNQFYLAPYAPLDGVPLVSSISSKESKKLPLPLQLLLQQVEFFNLSSLILSPKEDPLNPKAVGIRCQNCVSSLDGCGYIALSSVKDVASDLLTLSSDHLVHCKCTETSVRNMLKSYSVADIGNLSDYCRIVTKIYGLEDLTNTDASVVVWGECQTVPSGYTGSPNINIDFASI